MAAATDALEADRLATRPITTGVSSPFTDQTALESIVWADLTGQAARPLSRADVMAIPAHARQRHLLCGTVARCPLVQMEGATRTEDQLQPRWMTRTDGTVSPYHRMLWTTDDLIHHGWSLWFAVRGFSSDPDTQRGQLLEAPRLDWDRWRFESTTGRILVDDLPVDSDQVILIPGPHEGVLNFGGPALRRTIDNLEAAANAARNPSAYLELHYTGDEPMTDEKIRAARAQWASARRGEFGGVAFTGKYLEVKEHGTHEGALLIDGRNADAVDVSRLVSSPAAMADATSAGASLTYETTDGRNGQFVDYGVGLYMDAIAARLSMDDVVARGKRTAFDVTQLTIKSPAPTGAPTLD